MLVTLDAALAVEHPVERAAVEAERPKPGRSSANTRRRPRKASKSGRISEAEAAALTGRVLKRC